MVLNYELSLSNQIVFYLIFICISLEVVEGFDFSFQSSSRCTIKIISHNSHMVPSIVTPFYFMCHDLIKKN